MAAPELLQLDTFTHAIAAVTPERVYVLPHPCLRGIISHYTIYAPEKSVFLLPQPEEIHIVPDASGCIVCHVTEDGLEIRFWGPSSRVVTIKNSPAGNSLFIMVEFLPCGANRLLNIPLSLLHNAVHPLAAVDVSLARSIAEGFETHCLEDFDPDVFFTALDRFFMQRLGATEPSPLSAHIISTVTTTNGASRISELARQTGYSERHLTRLMQEKLGMNIKLLSRIVRINAACRAMNSSALSLTDMAQSLRYHDQSHFIHDFTEICGISPGRYRERMSDFYNEELKLGATMPSK